MSLHNSDEALGKPLSVYGHVTDSIFTGATHIIPLADVAYIRKHAAEPSDPPFPDIPEGIVVCLNRSDTIFLHGDEAAAFTRAWCTYRHELEKPTLMPPIDDLVGMTMEVMKRIRDVQPPKHSTRVDFEHFLCYTGFATQPEFVQDMLWLAYAHGANSDEADGLLAKHDEQLRPGRCRIALMEAGEAYPESSCERCGSVLFAGFKCPLGGPPETKSGYQSHKGSHLQDITGAPE